MQEEIDSVKAELTKAKATVKDLQGLGGRKVAVTGALRGCGPAIVKRLLQEGAFVVAADRGMSDEQAEAAGLRPTEGAAANNNNNTPEADALEAGRLVFFDMGGPGEEAGACGLSSLCVESFGGMDGLVCNTSARSMLVGAGAGAAAAVPNGVGGGDSSSRSSNGGNSNNLLEDLEPTDWADALTGALTEPMLAVKHALPLLQSACAKGKVASGGIVNVVCTSSADGAGAPGSSAEALSNRETLAAAAGGLAGLTHALAVSSGPYVRVNAVSVPEGSGRSAAGSSASTRAGRVGKDAASAVTFLLSSRAGSVTGQNLVVDDGLARKK